MPSRIHAGRSCWYTALNRGGVVGTVGLALGATSGVAAAGAGSGIHNCQPVGGGPHAGSGLHPGGAIHPSGGGGQLGGGLKRMAVPGGTDEDFAEDALRNTATR